MARRTDMVGHMPLMFGDAYIGFAASITSWSRPKLQDPYLLFAGEGCIDTSTKIGKDLDNATDRRRHWANL